MMMKLGKYENHIFITLLIASVSNNDGDVNESGKKAKGLLNKS